MISTSTIKNLKKISFIVLTFCTLLLLTPKAFANPAIVTLTTPSASYVPGSTIEVKININSNGSSLITAQLFVSYDASKVSYSSVGSGAGFITNQTPIGNNGSVIDIVGFNFNTISGSNIHFATINFIANSTGSAAFGIASGTQVNNNNAVNIFTQAGSSGKTVTIADPPAPVIPPTNPTNPSNPSTGTSQPSNPASAAKPNPSNQAVPNSPANGQNNSSSPDSNNTEPSAPANDQTAETDGANGTVPPITEEQETAESTEEETFASENDFLNTVKKIVLYTALIASIGFLGYVIFIKTRQYINKRNLLGNKTGDKPDTKDGLLDFYPMSQATGKTINPNSSSVAPDTKVDISNVNPKSTLLEIEKTYGHKK